MKTAQNRAERRAAAKNGSKPSKTLSELLQAVQPPPGVTPELAARIQTPVDPYAIIGQKEARILQLQGALALAIDELTKAHGTIEQLEADVAAKKAGSKG